MKKICIIFFNLLDYFQYFSMNCALYLQIIEIIINKLKLTKKSFLCFFFNKKNIFQNFKNCL